MPRGLPSHFDNYPRADFQDRQAVKGLRNGAEKDPIHIDFAQDILKALFSADYDSETIYTYVA